MSETVRQKAAKELAEIEEVTAAALPVPAGEIVPLEAAEAPVAEGIRTRMNEIDMGNTQSIISFGSAAQGELQVISQAMLNDLDIKNMEELGAKVPAFAHADVAVPGWMPLPAR